MALMHMHANRPASFWAVRIIIGLIARVGPYVILLGNACTRHIIVAMSLHVGFWVDPMPH
jgi:hypothetical protein